MRYGAYLQGLHDGLITLPTFYFMLFFRALFELSLGRLSRQREFRADQMAVATTSPREKASQAQAEGRRRVSLLPSSRGRNGHR